MGIKALTDEVLDFLSSSSIKDSFFFGPWAMVATLWRPLSSPFFGKTIVIFKLRWPFSVNLRGLVRTAVGMVAPLLVPLVAGTCRISSEDEEAVEDPLSLEMDWLLRNLRCCW